MLQPRRNGFRYDRVYAIQLRIPRLWIAGNCGPFRRWHDQLRRRRRAVAPDRPAAGFAASPSAMLPGRPRARPSAAFGAGDDFAKSLRITRRWGVAEYSYQGISTRIEQMKCGKSDTLAALSFSRVAALSSWRSPRLFTRNLQGGLALKYLPGHNLDRYRRQAKKGVFSPC